MSDFLDHLLNRSQAQSAGLTPRSVSVYEPAPDLGVQAPEKSGIGLPAFPVRAEARHHRPAAPDQPVPPDPLDRVSRRLDALQAWLGRLDMRSESGLGEPAVPRPPAPTRLPHETHRLARPLPVPPTPTQDQPAPVQVGEQYGPSNQPIQPPPASHVIQERVVTIRPARPSAQTEAPPGASGSLRASHRPLEPRVEEEPERGQLQQPSDPDRTDRDAGRLAPRPSSPPAPAGKERRERQTPASPPPVVHVTIGRIEVRANRRAAPFVASGPLPQTPSVISLEEYLRQRRGGSGG